jgi:predicted ABC-type ATPase
MDGPNLILLAGPNGAGKTTASQDLLARALNIHHFVNADEIALDLEVSTPRWLRDAPCWSACAI